MITQQMPFVKSMERARQGIASITVKGDDAAVEQIIKAVRAGTLQGVEFDEPADKARITELLAARGYTLT
jgi:hypothetical protein